MSGQIFIDTANIFEIKKWFSCGIIDGVTTNQKIFFKEKNINISNIKKRVLSICRLGNFPVSMELTSHVSAEEMVKEAKKYHLWHRNIVVKVPMTSDGEGLKAIFRLKKMKIKTNATLMVSYVQMILAIKAGADFVSLFFNRSKEAGYDPKEILKKIKEFIVTGGYKSRIISGSIRSSEDVVDAFCSGSDIVAVTPDIFRQMLLEKRTEETIKEFDLAWKEFLRR